MSRHASESSETLTSETLTVDPVLPYSTAVQLYSCTVREAKNRGRYGRTDKVRSYQVLRYMLYRTGPVGRSARTSPSCSECVSLTLDTARSLRGLRFSWHRRTATFPPTEGLCSRVPPQHTNPVPGGTHGSAGSGHGDERAGCGDASSSCSALAWQG
eukprot:SAG22_NODE_119_length_19257_cov_43.260413_13_plen_157_part_00